MGIGIWELVVLLVIVALIFGTQRLRNIGGDLGSAIKGFRKAMSDDESGKDHATSNETTKPQDPN